MNKDKAVRIEEFKCLTANSYCFYLANHIAELDLMGFFDAPASTKYHGAYPGGLFDHSKAVTEALLMLTNKLNLSWENPRSPYVVGLLHDICKCSLYIKVDNGFAYNKETLLDGHGDKSAIIAQRILCGSMTDEEIACIRWHMGAFDKEERWSYYRNAVSIFPNVLYTHTADMIASAIHNT